MSSVRTLCLSALGICVSVLAASATAAEPALPVPKAEETWQVIYLAGQRVGYARILVSPVEIDGQTLVSTETETHLSIKRFGQTLNMSTSLNSRETLAGDLRSFEFRLSNPPATSSVMSGGVDGSKLRLSSEVDGRTTQTVTTWKSGIKSPTFQDRWLRAQPLKPGESKEFEVFFPEFSKPGTLGVAAGNFETVSLLDGRSEKLQRMTVTNSLLPGIKTTAWINDRGDSIKSSTSMLGTEMVTFSVPKAEALKQLTVAELDLGVATLVKIRRISDPYQTRKVVYRVTIPDEDPSEAIPTGDTQAVRRISEHVAEVTVTALPLPVSATVSAAADEFLQPTRYLQSDDQRVQEHARAAAGDATNPGDIARRMEAYVSTKLAKKNFSTALASAGEVARNLEGDCTEHAVLLAAMLRAKGVPSRVAVGLVYVDKLSAFGGHMWTEAQLDGKWIPLDATLGRGGVGATHIKLGDATFAEDNGAPLAAFSSLITVIGKLQIDVVEAN